MNDNDNNNKIEILLSPVGIGVWRHEDIKDAELGRWSRLAIAPICEGCHEPMIFKPNKAPNEYPAGSINAALSGWFWCRNECGRCASCHRMFPKGQSCDCWSCPCYAPVPGATTRLYAVIKKGEPCFQCGCLEGQCQCSFGCEVCGVRRQTPVCPCCERNAASIGMSMEAYIDDVKKTRVEFPLGLPS